MKISLGLFPSEYAPQIVDEAALAGTLGYSSVWLGDSQCVWRDFGIVAGAIANRVNGITIGSGVSNISTRDLSVLASMWVSLAELTDGRVVCGLGTGYSSLGTLGRKARPLKELEAAVNSLRCLWSGDSIPDVKSGAQIHLGYVREPTSVPIYLAGSGPRSLELAGRVADGVIMMVGSSKEMISTALTYVRRGAQVAGRNIEDINIVLWTQAAVAQTSAQAVDRLRPRVARILMNPFIGEVDSTESRIVDTLRRRRSTYDFYSHQSATENDASIVPDSLVEKFAVGGTAMDVARRLEELESVGVNEVVFVPTATVGEQRVESISALITCITN